MMGLGVFSWQTTKSPVKQGPTGSQDLIETMMQTEDAKRGLKFGVKEMWLEVFQLGGVGEKGFAKVVWCCAMRLAPEACCGDIAAEELRAQHEYDSFTGLTTKGLLVQTRQMVREIEGVESQR
jgi:hypothetical protein